MLSKKAKPDLKDNLGWTALITAICSEPKSDHENIVKLLLDNNANKDIQDKDGRTALIFASYYGYKNILKILLDKGANPNLKASNGKTAIDFAANSEIKSLLTSYLKK